MEADEGFEQALSNYLNATSLTDRRAGGHAGADAFDRGRASAMRNLGLASCSYLVETEFELRDLWMVGYRSFLSERSWAGP